MKTQAAQAQIANLLGVTIFTDTEQGVDHLARVIISMKIGVTCGRCGGSGKHSFNSISKDVCFGCAGRKVLAPKSAAQWRAMIAVAETAVENGHVAAYHRLCALRREAAALCGDITTAYKAMPAAGQQRFCGEYAVLSNKRRELRDAYKFYSTRAEISMQEAYLASNARDMLAQFRACCG